MPNFTKNYGIPFTFTQQEFNNFQLTTIRNVFREDKNKRELLLNFIQKSFPQIVSLLYCINSKGNDSIYDQEIYCYSGQSFISEHIDDLQFKITAKSFYQTNPKQSKTLYNIAKSFAGLKPKDVVYDLYTGTGTIAQFVARDAKCVIGIDSVPEAIEAAIESAKFNKIKNCDFFSGDMKNLFTDEFISQHGKPNLVITDPPRDGMHKKVIEQLKRIKPKKIIYISCNSATQSRDISLLYDLYEITNMQTVDMFPQTHHVENILILELR